MTYNQNPYLPHSQRIDAPVAAPKQAPPTITTREGVPVGTTVQIVEWVGEDAERAHQALDRERTQERPRVKLVTELTSIIRRAERAAAEPLVPA